MFGYAEKRPPDDPEGGQGRCATFFILIVFEPHQEAVPPMALNKAAPAKARRAAVRAPTSKAVPAKKKPKSATPKRMTHPEAAHEEAAHDDGAHEPVALAAVKDDSHAAVEPPAAAKPKAKPKPNAKSKKKKAPSKRAQPKGLVQRVYNTIDGELSKLEAQTGASSQDRERASRALSQMVSSLEKAVEMQREIAKDGTKGGNAKDKEALRHAEDLRQQIADRVEQLQLERASDKRSEGAD